MAAAVSIDDLIPHRPPFRYVDELVAVGDERGIFALNLAANDARLRVGVSPALLLVEALAQSTAAFHGALGGAGGEGGVLVSIDSARLHASPPAGSRVLLAVERTHHLGLLVRFNGIASVDDVRLVEAELTVQRGGAP